MKKAALLILGVLLAGNALAQFDYPGRKLNRLTLEIIEKAKQAAEKAPDEAAKIEAFTAYLETQKEEYKEASIEACIAEQGVEKAGACSCGAENPTILASSAAGDSMTSTGRTPAPNSTRGWRQRRCRASMQPDGRTGAITH